MGEPSKNSRYRKRHAEQIAARARLWSATNRHKRRAHNLLRKAILTGVLVRPGYCELCKITCVPHGHHDDYGKPLDVRWVCRKCHSAIHADQRMNAVRARKNFARGEKVGASKLTEKTVRLIKDELHAKSSAKRAIARKYNVSESLIRQIAKGEIWTQVK